jgi:DNA-binding GntR family transcriptional regulator
VNNSRPDRTIAENRTLPSEVYTFCMAKTSTADTLSSHVYEQIRHEILHGGFLPGERLKPGELRARFGVSVSVLREALSRLAEHRLVQSELNHGFRVAPLSEKDLRDLTDIRVLVEGFALRRSIQNGGTAWQGRVVAAHYVMDVTPIRSPENPSETSEEWSKAHRHFHRSLVEMCDMPALLAICDSLFDASELYRRASARVARDGRDVRREHREIMEATMAGQRDLAANRLESHFRQTEQLVLSGLRTSGILVAG